MKMASAPGRRSKLSFPSSANRYLPPQSPNLQNGPINRKSTSVAQVAPMVKGHRIHKPNVRITRLNLDDLNLLTRPQQQIDDDDRNGQNEENENDENVSDVDMNEAGDRDADADVDDDDEVELSVPRPRRRIREPESPALEPVMEGNEEEEDEEEEDDEDGNFAGSTVLLLPRLVLERVTISPTKSAHRRSSLSSRRSTMTATRRRSSSAPSDFVLPRQQRSAANVLIPTEASSEGNLEASDHEADDFDSHWTESSESVSLRPVMNRKVSFQFDGANLSPIPALGQVRKRGRSSILKKELKIVVADFRKSSDNPESHQDGTTSTNGASADAAASDNEAPDLEAASQSTSPDNSIDDDDEMMIEMYQYDPIEGPSWLLDTHTRRRGQKSQATKSKPPKVEAEPKKPENVRPETTEATSSHAQNESRSDVVQDDVVSQSNESSVAASSTTTTRVTESDEIGNGSRISEPIDESTTRESGRPSKRRAAAAVASFKEPSLNKKLRQGDDLNKDAKFKERKTKKKSGVGEKK